MTLDDAVVTYHIGIYAERVGRAQVAQQAARTSRRTDTAYAQHLLARNHAALLEACQQRGRLLHVEPHFVITPANIGYVGAYHGRLVGRKRMKRPEGADKPLAEAVAAPRLRGVDSHGA